MEASVAVNMTAPDEDALVAGTRYHLITHSTEVKICTEQQGVLWYRVEI